MDKLEFYKNWYEKEDERRVALENSLSIPIGVLTGVFAIQFFILNEFDFLVATHFQIVTLIVLLSISILGALTTTFFLFKSYHNFFAGFRYTALPNPTELIRYESDLISYYTTHSAYYSGATGEVKFQEYLIEKYIEHCGRNTQNNDQKSSFLYRSKASMLVSIIALFFTLIPFLTNFFIKPQQAQKIEITNLKEIEIRLNSIEKLLEERERRVDTTTTSSTTSETTCR